MGRSRRGGKGLRRDPRREPPPKRPPKIPKCHHCKSAHKLRRGGYCADCLPPLVERWSEHVSAKHADAILARYNLTVEDHATMFFDQKGLCAICRDPIRSRRRGNERGLVVDHDHDTGFVRALLCHKCNAAIGLMAENTKWLKRAASYVRQNLDLEAVEGTIAVCSERVAEIKAKNPDATIPRHLRERLDTARAKRERLMKRPVARGYN